MPLLETAIGAGAALLGDGINSVSQAQQNRASRQFALSMYRRQYADSIALWNMQNAYNSPEAQMQRYRDAGLNPNLIYGQQNTASPAHTPDVAQPEFRSPEWGSGIRNAGLTYMNAIYDLDIKQAQADNLRAQNTVIAQDALLRVAQIAQTRTGTARAQFDLDLASELRSTSAEAAREALRQMKLNMDLATRKDAREAVATATNVREAASRMATAYEQRLTSRLQRAQTREEIKRIKADINLIRSRAVGQGKDNVLKQLDINLKKQGIMPSDPLWSRFVAQYLETYFTSPKAAENFFGRAGKLGLFPRY